MRKLILSMNLSLDGFLSDENEGLDWHTEKWGQDIAHKLTKELSEADTILLGRKTYHVMACFWPDRQSDLACPGEDFVYGWMMNTHKKVVYSETLSELSWQNSSVATGPLASVMQTLKTQTASAKNIIVYGSAMLAQALTKLNLVDEYQLWIHPTLLGKGNRFFNMQTREKLKLKTSESFDSGVVLLCYEPNNESD